MSSPEGYHDPATYELVPPEQHHVDHSDGHGQEHGQPASPEPTPIDGAAIEEAPVGARIEPPKGAGNRVRFRSISSYQEADDRPRPPVPERPVFLRNDSDYSVRSYHSMISPYDEPASAPASEASVADLGARTPPDSRQVSQSEIPLTQAGRGLGQGQPTQATIETSTPGRTMSVSERFRHAGNLIRQQTVFLGERLGRDNFDDGGDLGASLLPDDLEGVLPPLHPERPRDEEKGAMHDQGSPPEPLPSAEAHRLVRSVTQGRMRRRRPRSAYARSGQSTPEGGSRPDSWYGSGKFAGGGILGQLLRLQAVQSSGSSSAPVSDVESDGDSPISSGTATPKKEKLKWYKKSNHHSAASLVGASMNLSSATLPAPPDAFMTPKRGKKKPYRKTRLEDEIRVTVHIAEILARQRYIMNLCRALMRYGAPTHRMEEYMKMTARVLEVEGQFLYLPGCMIMSFDDPTTRTAEVKLVRVVQGVDLGRLADTHNVYKNVVHDLIGVEEAISELDQIMSRKPRFNKWLLVPAYGFASVAVGPFAFQARPIDMPIIFLLGSLVGLMQHVLAPKSVLYSNVFEVTAAVLTSFLARAFGSIPDPNNNEEHLFCFSALSQSSIALILPGFMVLCSSLELQSHQIIAGSIRMVYAIIYSLFLGYGVTVGTTIYGLIDMGATSERECPAQDVYGSPYTQRFCFVPLFVIFVAIINQAKFKQLPAMILIALSGYITNYFSTLKLGSNSEVANTVGAFTIGLLGNLYSRVWRGHAAAAILPAIFVLVPSGLASSGSLIAGLNYADSVREGIKTGNTNNIASQDTSIASLGFGMVQIAIGITVGLFVSALVVYPFGKRRSGLFNF
ncbi:threonine/serine exporter family protein [Aspergillus undulatus]|uniref:threonine/serine exporter family protein n=1 Tax=Aspergillus undulatus TaxID=1810928 RepID=UPI003CCE482F